MAETFNPMPTWAECQKDPSKRRILSSIMDQCVQESFSQMGYWNLYTRCVANLYLYLQGSRFGSPAFKVSRNRIQNVVISNTAIQVGDRPTATFKPREYGEPPVYYVNTLLNLKPPEGQQPEQVGGRMGEMNGDGAPAQSQLAQVLANLPEETHPEDGVDQMPLEGTQIAYVQAEVAKADQMRQMAIQANQPEPIGLLPKDFLLTVNEQMEADAAQLLMDYFTKRSKHGMYVQQNDLYNNIYGWQLMLTELDKPNNKFKYRNCECGTVHLDPFKTDIGESAYAIFDEYLGAEEAIALNPDLKTMIDQKATVGPPAFPGFVPSTAMLPYYRGFTGRRIVIIRTAWYRDQPFPLTPEDAIKGGTVVPAMVPVNPAVSDKPAPLMGGLGGVIQNVRNFFTGGGDGAGAVDDAGGAGVAGDSAPVVDSGPTERPAYFLKDRTTNGPDHATGEVDPLHPKWPVRYSIREIKSIATEIVADGETQRADIPLGHNVNIQIPSTPWGQGEPERLESLQRGYDSLLTNMDAHGRACAFPAKVIPESVAAANPRLAREGFTNPNQVLTIPDRLLMAFNGDAKKLIGIIEAPQLPADIWREEQVFDRSFKDESNSSEVLQGNLPGQGALSGEAISNLQGYAVGTIKMKSQRLEDMLRSQYQLMLYDLVYQYTPEELFDVVRGFPKAVWSRVHERMKKYCEDPDMEIAISTTSQANAGETSTLIQAKQAGVQVSQQTLQKRLKLDPETEMQNDMKWQAQMQPAMPQQPAPKNGQAQGAHNGG